MFAVDVDNGKTMQTGFTTVVFNLLVKNHKENQLQEIEPFCNTVQTTIVCAIELPIGYTFNVEIIIFN